MEPPGLLDLLSECRTEMAEVEDAGCGVRYGEASSLLIEARILDRNRDAMSQELDHVDVVLAESLLATDSERPERAPSRLEADGRDGHALVFDLLDADHWFLGFSTVLGRVVEQGTELSECFPSALRQNFQAPASVVQVDSPAGAWKQRVEPVDPGPDGRIDGAGSHQLCSDGAEDCHLLQAEAKLEIGAVEVLGV